MTRYEKEAEFSFEKLGQRIRNAFSQGDADETIHHSTFSTPLDAATHAVIEISAGIARLNITALEADADDLIQAEIAHRGEVSFEALGETDKVITLKQTGSSQLGLRNNNALAWDIRLHPAVGLTLRVRGGVGEATVDLTNLNTSYIEYKGGVGSATIMLPGQHPGVTGKFRSGVGELTLNIPAQTTSTLDIKGGVGSVTVNMDAAIEGMINARIGVGEISVPETFSALTEKRVFTAQRGIWTTENHDDAAHPVTIQFRGGMGDFNAQIIETV
jgi:hypothetical protein